MGHPTLYVRNPMVAFGEHGAPGFGGWRLEDAGGLGVFGVELGDLDFAGEA